MAWVARVRRWCGSKFGVGGVGPQNFVGSVEGGVGRNFRFGGADQKKACIKKNSIELNVLLFNHTL